MEQRSKIGGGGEGDECNKGAKGKIKHRKMGVCLRDSDKWGEGTLENAKVGGGELVRVMSTHAERDTRFDL